MPDAAEDRRAKPLPGTPIAVAGDRSDGTALTNLLTALATLGLITDNTVA